MLLLAFQPYNAGTESTGLLAKRLQKVSFEELECRYEAGVLAGEIREYAPDSGFNKQVKYRA